MIYTNQNKEKQSGQTLIETIVAIFILTTALTAGLGMSLYALNGAAKDKSQIIATNLAREGIDVARKMRDSNWLSSGASGPPSTCSDLSNQPCYPTAFTSPNNFNLSVGGSNSSQWRYRFTPSTRTWSIDQSPGSSRNFLLCLITDTSSQYYGTYQHNDPGNSGITCDNGLFARRIIISVRSGTTYNYSATDLDNSEVIVQSVVQWAGKNCPLLDNNTTPTATAGACKVIAEERLTNWKDYR